MSSGKHARGVALLSHSDDASWNPNLMKSTGQACIMASRNRRLIFPESNFDYYG